jgi:hypothetical protein
MKHIRIKNIAYPIVVLRIEDGVPSSQRIIGTCFYIGNQFMMTAGHVLEILNNLLEDKNFHSIVCLYSPETGGYMGFSIMEVERISYDIGIMKVLALEESDERLTKLSWLKSTLNEALIDVGAFGFPYGIVNVHNEIPEFVQRAFKGYIVSYMRYFSIPGSSGEMFPVYELSFQAPEGLSGSPLITLGPFPRVIGVIIGNNEISSGDPESIPLALGIAVVSNILFSEKSKLLGSTLYDYLEQNELFHI